MKSPRRSKKAVEPEVQCVPKITAAHLQALALKTQADVLFLTWPILLEALIEAAKQGRLGVAIRLDQLLAGSNIDQVTCGIALCLELQRIGCAAQIARHEDSRGGYGWERAVIEISWKEAAV